MPSPLPDRSRDLRAYKPLVRQIAGQLRAHLSSNVRMDDLIQSGLIGLNEALARFEEGHGARFETYAARRVRGAMLDELRAQDPLSRGDRSRLREVSEAVQRLEHQLGRTPRSKEVAAALGWPLQELHDCMAESGAGARRESDLALEDMSEALSAESEPALDLPAEEQADPLRAAQFQERMAALHASFDALDEIERFVMEAIYDQGMDTSDIGAILGVSRSRVSQMSAAIVEKLRQRLQDY